ncbi:MAG TPA: 4'-phosphopantetheinyl transferase superfamily protein [Anaerolineales bacterium]|nr:4'-phosphopantetheinyl transferase superfamily protein [Anaerolineales bacterium]
MTDIPQPERYLATLLSQPLTGSDLHVWCASLIGSADELARYESMLAQDEKARAGRFYFERDRDRYIFGRGILRTLLGGYLRLSPDQINFTYEPDGKPAVEHISPEHKLQFNLAHSNAWAVYIFGWDRLVGIDIEHIRPLQDANHFAGQYYTARESELINSLSGDEKWATFYKIWTCKEAFLKAKGTGLTVPINHAEISLQTSNSAHLASIDGDTEQAAVWRLEIFNPIANYQAAIAVEGHAGGVLYQSITGPA